MFNHIKEVDNYVRPNNSLKTRLCKNINCCSYGSNCHYAHSLEDIVIVDCAYNDKCIFIENSKEGGCLNSNITLGKICFFKHPNETIEQYHVRVGNIPSENKINKKIEINPIKIDLDQNKNIERWYKVVNNKKITVEDDYEKPTKVKASEVVNIIEDVLDRQIKEITLVIDYEE